MSPGDAASTMTSLWRVCPLATTSHRLHPSNGLPPLKAPTSGVRLRLRRRSGLTFRVSRRLISRFSSISSCSLRAAENERVSARTYKPSPGTSKKRSLKPKTVFIVGCLILLEMHIRGEGLLCSFEALPRLFCSCLRSSN